MWTFDWMDVCIAVDCNNKNTEIGIKNVTFAGIYNILLESELK